MSDLDKINNFSIVDLFSGIGGLSHGFFLEGFKIAAGVDLDDTCAYAYEKNNMAKFHPYDVTQLSGQEIDKLFLTGTEKILVGCAPCQDFSIYNQKNKEKSGKWKLVNEFARLIIETQPAIVSMENVPQLRLYEDGNVLKKFIDILECENYNVTYKLINAQDYGVPQRRKRLVLFACKKEKGFIHIISPTHIGRNKTVKNAIGHLPKIKDGEICMTDNLHRTRKLSDLNKRRIQAMREGGFWREWSEDLKLPSQKKQTSNSFRSVYGRMKWDDVSPTLTTYCIGINYGRFGHPEQDRAISLREAALLQSFPDYYELINPNARFSMSAIARHIGNAVPVDLARVIAQSIKLHIKNAAYGDQ